MNLQTTKPNGDFLKEFLAGRSPNTIQSYKEDLAAFSKFTQTVDAQTGICFLIGSSQGDANRTVLNFRNHLKDIGQSPATINRKLATIRSCIKFARLCGFINWNIEVQNLKSEAYRDTSGPGLYIFQKMINKLTVQKNPKAFRDIAILRLMFDLGLRVSEVTQINLADLELEKNSIWIKGKGKTQRQLLTLPNNTKISLKKWISTRESDCEAVFINFDRAKNRKRISRIGIYNLIKDLGSEVGVKTRPHGIRHLSITEACKAAQSKGLALEDVLSHSRHKSISTLMIYRDRNENSQGNISTALSMLI